MPRGTAQFPPSVSHSITHQDLIWNSRQSFHSIVTLSLVFFKITITGCHSPGCFSILDSPPGSQPFERIRHHVLILQFFWLIFSGLQIYHNTRLLRAILQLEVRHVHLFLIPRLLLCTVRTTPKLNEWFCEQDHYRDLTNYLRAVFRIVGGPTERVGIMLRREGTGAMQSYVGRITWSWAAGPDTLCLY